MHRRWMTRRITFHVKAHDGIDLIGEGRHERFVVMWDRFNARRNRDASVARSRDVTN